MINEAKAYVEVSERRCGRTEHAWIDHEPFPEYDAVFVQRSRGCGKMMYAKHGKSTRVSPWLQQA